MPKPPDRVQLLKRESAASGGDGADNDPFELELPLDPSEDAPEVQGIYFQTTVSGSEDEEVYISRDGDDMIFRDATTITEHTLTELLATASGSGLTENQHKALRDVVHFIDGPGDGFASGAYREIVGQPFPTSIVWYESASKAQKILEQSIAYPSKVAPTPVIWKMYDTDGSTVLVEVQDDITYDGAFEINRTRTITV